MLFICRHIYIAAVLIFSSCLQLHKPYSPPEQDYDRMLQVRDKLFDEAYFNEYLAEDMAKLRYDMIRPYQYLSDNKLMREIDRRLHDYMLRNHKLADQLLLLAMKRGIPAAYAKDYYHDTTSVLYEEDGDKRAYKRFLYALKASKLNDKDVWFNYNMDIEDEETGMQFNGRHYLADKLHYPKAMYGLFSAASSSGTRLGIDNEKALYYYKECLKYKSTDIFVRESYRLLKKRKYRQAFHVCMMGEQKEMRKIHRMMTGVGFQFGRKGIETVKQMGDYEDNISNY